MPIEMSILGIDRELDQQLIVDAIIKYTCDRFIC